MKHNYHPNKFTKVVKLIVQEFGMTKDELISILDLISQLSPCLAIRAYRLEEDEGFWEYTFPTFPF